MKKLYREVEVNRYKEIVRKLIEKNPEWTEQNSLFNCHAKGLHSIALCPPEDGNGMVRMFVTSADHVMYKNLPDYYGHHDMSIAFHPHHCGIRFLCVKGMFMNWIVEESPDGYLMADKFLYESKISNGVGRFSILDSSVSLQTLSCGFVTHGDYCDMKADEVHTVAVKQGDKVAWLVMELEESKTYTPYCYSNRWLERETLKGLYEKRTMKDIIKLLESVDL